MFIIRLTVLTALVSDSLQIAPWLVAREKAVQSCTRSCDGNGDPVCGSNGQIYKSICVLEEMSCLKAIEGYNLTRQLQLSTKDCTKTEPGDCESLIHETCINLYGYQYVCGSDIMSYSSICELDKRNCLRQKAALADHGNYSAVTLRHLGFCHEPDYYQYTPRPLNCDLYFTNTTGGPAAEGGHYFCRDYPKQTICSSEHITYSSYCDMCADIESRNHTHQHVPQDLHILYNRTCHQWSVVG